MSQPLLILGPTNTDWNKEIALREIETKINQLIAQIDEGGLVGPHAPTHENGGSDPLTLSLIAGSLSYGQLPSGGGTWANGGNLTLTGGSFILPATGSAHAIGSTVFRNMANPNVSTGAAAVPTVQLQGASTNSSTYSFGRWAVAATGPSFLFMASRGATIGDVSPVATDDILGQIAVSGDDGTDYQTLGGRLRFVVSGTVTSSRIPTDVVLQLANGAVADDMSNVLRIFGATRQVVLGGGAITSGARLEVRHSTGTATLEPAIIRARTTSTGGDWAIGSANFWASFEAYSDDATSPGASVRGRLGFFAENAAGTPNGAALWVGPSSGLVLTQIWNSDLSVLFAGSLRPATSDVAALGSATLMWSDLFLASGAVVNFNNGNYTLTHSAALLTTSGAVSFGGSAQPASSGGAALGTTALMWSNLFLASGSVINWNNGNYTITHTPGLLTLSGQVRVDGQFSVFNSNSYFNTGDVTVTDASNARFIFIDTPSGTTALIKFGASGTSQWTFGKNTAAGANLELTAEGIDIPLSIVRAGGGTISLARPVAITTGKLSTAASVAGYASINLPHGSAPSAPVDGDMWTTTAGLYVRVNGSTVGPLS